MLYLRLRRRLRRRLQTWCPVPADLDGAVELDESYFGPRRVHGKRGRGASGKTIVFGLFKRGEQVCTEIVPDCSKKTLRAIIRGKIDCCGLTPCLAFGGRPAGCRPATT